MLKPTKRVQARPAIPPAAPHIELAADALLDGWTRERVIAAMLAHIERDAGYLAYRRSVNRHTRYDEQVWADMQALALAAVWLQEAAAASVPAMPTAPARKHA